MSLFKDGFTVTELLVTLTIVSMLSVIAIPAYINYMSKARIADVLSTLEPVKKRVSELVLQSGSVNGVTLSTQQLTDIQNASDYINTLTLNDGVIDVGLNPSIGIEDLNMRIAPQLGSAGVEWSCSATENGTSIVPNNCKSILSTSPDTFLTLSEFNEVNQFFSDMGNQAHISVASIWTDPSQVAAINSIVQSCADNNTCSGVLPRPNELAIGVFTHYGFSQYDGPGSELTQKIAEVGNYIYQCSQGSCSNPPAAVDSTFSDDYFEFVFGQTRASVTDYSALTHTDEYKQILDYLQEAPAE